jgi:L-asparaginase II
MNAAPRRSSTGLDGAFKRIAGLVSPMAKGLGGEPAVLVRRGAVVESVHRAIVAVVDPGGKILARLGDPAPVTFLRSAAKPFQALALVESGGAEAFGLTDPELAIIAGSHSGEDRHVKVVEGILARGGLGPEALQCGIHRPYHGPTAERLGTQATVLHHNCSGKHAGMLLLAKHLGAPVKDYIDPDSPGQRRIRKTLAEVAGLRPAQVKLGTDGCSAPNFAISVKAMAVAFARLGVPERSPAHVEALRRVRDAMLFHPAMVAGEDRFDTDLMEAFAGALVSKSGAEGVEGAAVSGKAWGIAVKIEDGNQRAVPPVMLEALRQLRVARAAHLKAVDVHLNGVMRNWAGREVGGMEPRFRLRR